MERLTRADIDNVELVEFENDSVNECLKDIDTVDYLNILGALIKLQDYEDMEEHGKLVLFPEYAYFVKDNKVYKGWVQEVVYAVCRKPLYDIRYDNNSIASYRGYLGNKVFLTKEEAEKALERLECAE